MGRFCTCVGGGGLVRAGATIATDTQYGAFHAAKYRVYLQMYDDVQRAQRLMQD